MTKVSAKVRGGRKSAISSRISDEQVVNQILETKISLSFGEMLASSKELSSQLIELLKAKNSKPTIMRIAAPDLFTRSPLIKLRMECDYGSLVAIIDTGSQLNVVSHDAWQKKIGRPKD
ncbi:hypothetical protein PLICRDRAFT_120030, partial [Plicaturopsis crispa FD-325 SS-3]